MPRAGLPETGHASGFLVKGTRAQLSLAVLSLSCFLKYISVSAQLARPQPLWMSLKHYGPWRAPGERGH